MENNKKDEKEEKMNNIQEDTQKETKENKKEVSEKKGMVLKEEYDDLNDHYKRILAEFDNFKKRSQKEKESLYTSVLSDVIEVILPVVDNLENALKAETKDESYKQGIELVLKQFKDVLKSKGVEEIPAVGETFDPEIHDAVSMIQDENLGEKVIAQEYRKGYKIGNKVIRHSMVVVAN